MNRRNFLQTLSVGAASAAALLPAPATSAPNFVVILADDLGYGDLGCYGSKIRTPNIDQLAKSGALFRNFCVASPVCSPSRAALLTGRYGVRGGVPYVVGPEQKAGLSLTETTLAQTLKGAGYKTMCVGKWHLGTSPGYLPTARGFDEYYGIPYSNDNFPSVLMHDSDVIESPVALETVTQRYTQQAVQFIRRAKDGPFFLYMPHTAPHIPLAASAAFAGKSPLGPYGDVVEEMDWSVGQVLAELKAQSIDHNTLVIFSSDNGPWYQGNAGRLRGRKGDTFEGGMREPFLASWPGRIPVAQTIQNFASMLDLFPTIAGLAHAALPGNAMDGVNIWPMLTGEADSVDRPPFLYFEGYNLQCIRLGRWKLHLARFNGPAFAPAPAGGRLNLQLLNPELYDMVSDPGESYDVALENPSIVADIRARIDGLLLNLPVAVQTAWKDTLNRPTSPVNAGEYPALKT
jgi:arylsulfatase